MAVRATRRNGSAQHDAGGSGAEVELVPGQAPAWSQRREGASGRDAGEQEADREVWQATLSGSDDDEPTVNPFCAHIIKANPLAVI